VESESAPADAAAFRAWLIDLDGTLYAPLPVKLAMAFELGVRAPHRIRLLREFRREHEQLRHELAVSVESPFALQLERAAKRLGVSAHELAPIVTEWMFERPRKWIRAFARAGLLREIRAFRTRGGRTALVSDYPARVKLEALGASELFDAVIANGESGGPRRLKPHPDGFLRAAECLEVPAADCLVIGDRDDADGAAARAAGMSFRRIS